MRANTFAGQIIAVLSRRAPAFELDPAGPQTFPGRIKRLFSRRGHTGRRSILPNATGEVTASIANNAIRLARQFRDADCDTEATRVLLETAALFERSATSGKRQAFRPLADLLREAGDHKKAFAWYEVTAEVGDPQALSEAVTLLLNMDLPDQGGKAVGYEVTARAPDDPREIIRSLQQPDQQVIVQRVLMGDSIKQTATLLGVSESKARAYEDRALLTLEPELSVSFQTVANLPKQIYEKPGSEGALGVESGSAKDIDLGAAGADEDFGEPTMTSPFIGQVIGSTLSDEEKSMINLMDPKDRARYLLQKRMQEKAEMAVLLSQLQALRHQTAMSVM